MLFYAIYVFLMRRIKQSFVEILIGEAVLKVVSK